MLAELFLTNPFSLFFVFELIFESLAVYISQYHIFPFKKFWYWKITSSQPLSYRVLGLWYQSFHQPWLFFLFASIFFTIPHFPLQKSKCYLFSASFFSASCASSCACKAASWPCICGKDCHLCNDWLQWFDYIFFGFVNTNTNLKQKNHGCICGRGYHLYNDWLQSFYYICFGFVTQT